MNSSYSVSLSSLQVMVSEFKRGREVVKNILDHGGMNWGQLFEPSDFFVKYTHYVSCSIVGGGDDLPARSWLGYVESRLRRFPTFLAMDESLVSVHLHPVAFRLSKAPNSHTYFIGFDVDASKIRGGAKSVHLDDAISRFWMDLRKYSGEHSDELDFLVEHYKWGQLPKEVFLSIGGVEAAKSKRSELAKRVHAAKVQASSLVPEKFDNDRSSMEMESTQRVEGGSESLNTNRKRRLSFEEVKHSVGQAIEAEHSLPLLVPPPRFRRNPNYKTPVIVAWNVLESK